MSEDAEIPEFDPTEVDDAPAEPAFPAFDSVDAEKAYKAGFALPGVHWPDHVPAEQRVPNMSHCPFREGDPLREQYARGLHDALTQGAAYNPETILQEISDELRSEDAAS